jgi:catechol 2,3-dioxygenase-like lactoylglutathione lyase family enzyme
VSFNIELFVPDQWEAAEWYAKVLGFEVIQEHVHWAKKGGPLMISNDGGQTIYLADHGRQ